mgnify:CR=1 FL=1
MLFFNDRRKSANERALKAAQGPSLAPKGYKPDTAGRKSVKAQAMDYKIERMTRGIPATRKQVYADAVESHEFLEKNPIEAKAAARYKAQQRRDKMTPKSSEIEKVMKNYKEGKL